MSWNRSFLQITLLSDNFTFFFPIRSIIRISCLLHALRNYFSFIVFRENGYSEFQESVELLQPNSHMDRNRYIWSFENRMSPEIMWEKSMSNSSNDHLVSCYASKIKIIEGKMGIFLKMGFFFPIKRERESQHVVSRDLKELIIQVCRCLLVVGICSPRLQLLELNFF